MIKRYRIYIWQYNKWLKLPTSCVYTIDPNCQYALRLVCNEPCYLSLVGFEGNITIRDIKNYIKGYELACGFKVEVYME